MRALFCVCLLGVVGFGTVGLAGEARARLKVVATTPDLGALVSAVGGELVEVTVLAEPTEDPHYVDPRPSFLVGLSRADALVINGLELEIGWLPPLLVNARNPKIQAGAAGHIDASAMVKRLLGVPQQRVDRSMGDIHPGGNPHYSTSPRALADIARGLGARLGDLLPESRGALAQRGGEVARRIEAVGEQWRARFDGLPAQRKAVVVYHESFAYLIEWLGLSQVAAIENKPGIKPSPGHVANVLRSMRSSRAMAILQEEWHADATSKTLARLAEAELLSLPGGTRRGQAIEAHLEGIARRIFDALSR